MNTVYDNLVRKLLLGLLLCCAQVLAAADNENGSLAPQTTGLVWNRTGLPAVFPLQVKTAAGQDYFLKLIEDETGKDALAAYIVGGAFFKVLVPPGTYILRFDTGRVWQGEDALFGPGDDTLTFELEHPLTFEIRDFATKAGRLVDISKIHTDLTTEASVKKQFICQTTRTRFRPPSSTLLSERQLRRIEFQRRTGSYGPRQNQFDRDLLDETQYPNRFYRFFSYPRPVVQSRFC